MNIINIDTCIYILRYLDTCTYIHSWLSMLWWDTTTCIRPVINGEILFLRLGSVTSPRYEYLWLCCGRKVLWTRNNKVILDQVNWQRYQFNSDFCWHFLSILYLLFWVQLDKALKLKLLPPIWTDEILEILCEYYW